MSKQAKADRFPFIPLYAGDFLVGTQGLPADVVGVYIRLLCLEWETGPLTMEVAATAGEPETVREALDRKFVADDRGRYINHRLEWERQKLSRKRAGGKKRASAKRGEDGRYMELDFEPDDTADPVDDIPGDPPLLVFPCRRGRGQSNQRNTWAFRESFRQQLAQEFDRVDIEHQAREAHRWATDNASKRKTAGGMADFLRRWMAKHQERAADPASETTDASAEYARAQQIREDFTRAGQAKRKTDLVIWAAIARKLKAEGLSAFILAKELDAMRQLAEE